MRAPAILSISHYFDYGLQIDPLPETRIPSLTAADSRSISVRTLFPACISMHSKNWPLKSLRLPLTVNVTITPEIDEMPDRDYMSRPRLASDSQRDAPLAADVYM
jgi:hypothetical protein